MFPKSFEGLRWQDMVKLIEDVQNLLLNGLSEKRKMIRSGQNGKACPAPIGRGGKVIPVGAMVLHGQLIPPEDRTDTSQALCRL
jgi:hypothetical protein